MQKTEKALYNFDLLLNSVKHMKNQWRQSHTEEVMVRAGFSWCESRLIHFWGPSPIVTRKNGKALINLRKAENHALKVRSIKNSKSLLECPRSLHLSLPSTQKRSIARNCWNRTWLAGTGLLTSTGEQTEIATIEIFDKTHGLRFYNESPWASAGGGQNGHLLPPWKLGLRSKNF